jgi:hypothetical protein
MLTDEPCRNSLARVVDRAGDNTAWTIRSCVAAQAAGL